MGETTKGIVYADITLKNEGDVTNVRRGLAKGSDIRQTTVTAMVDTGAATLVINEAIRQQLGLEIEKEYEATLADGSDQTYGLTETVLIQWKDRDMTCRAVVIPNADKILLGAIPLEAMDLVVNPLKQELTGAHGDKAVFRV
jgi:clan AA aspartic protease